MLYKDDEFKNDRNDQSEQKPNAYRVNDDNVEEKDLAKSMTGSDAPGSTGAGSGSAAASDIR